MSDSTRTNKSNNNKQSNNVEAVAQCHLIEIYIHRYLAGPSRRLGVSELQFQRICIEVSGISVHLQPAAIPFFSPCACVEWHVLSVAHPKAFAILWVFTQRSLWLQTVLPATRLPLQMSDQV